MDIYSRYAYQTNKINRFNSMNFQPESMLDKFIVARSEAKDRLIIDSSNLEEVKKSLAEDVVNNIFGLLQDGQITYKL